MTPQMKRRMDALCEAANFDAAESAFFNRQLEQIRGRTYDIEYAELKGRGFVPVDNSLPSGAEVVTYHQFTMVGTAKMLASYGTDLPRADVFGKQFSSQIKGLGSSYGYSIQEIRNAQMAGLPLEQRKANSARRAVEQLIDTLSQTGNAAFGLKGLLNQASALSYTIPNGVAGSQSWDQKTPDEILADMHGIARYIVETTLDVEHPQTMILPLSSHGVISTRRMGDANNDTILAYFLKTSPYISSVESWYALETAGSGATKRIVCYDKNPDKLQLIISQEFEQFPPQQRGLEFVTPCHARCGGVVSYYPLSMAYGDGI